MISLEPSGNFNSIEDLEQTIISIPNSNQSFYLKDIARVYKDYPDPIESEFRVNNKSGIALAISMKDDWYRDWETDRKSTRLNSSHRSLSRMPSSA